MKGEKMEKGYRDRIFLLRLDRRVLATRLGLKYANFNNKLCRFSDFTPEQEFLLRKTLDEAEKAQQMDGENTQDNKNALSRLKEA
jgi:hypothetical protein